MLKRMAIARGQESGSARVGGAHLTAIHPAYLLGPKPRWRGRLHLLAAVASVPAGVLLVALVAHGATARIGAAVYALSLTGLFAASATHHHLTGTPWGRPWMRWVDHAMIFVLIAGSYTPICLVALPRRWGVPILLAAWATALAGVVMKLTSLKRYRRVGGFLYMAMGWAAVFALPLFFRNLSEASLLLMMTGGLLYTIGAIVLYRRRPNPRPAVFGYHEIWHAFVVAAGACHFGMVAIVVHAG